MNGRASAIELRDLRVERGGAVVLPGLTLDVPKGLVIGLLGPSGCGKTTLLRSIVGVQRTAGGTVTVLGLPAGSAPLRSRIGYLTQSSSVYHDLTVAENVRYLAIVAGLPRGAVAAEVARVLAEVDLTALAGRRVAELSGGQLSRVSLAGALVGSPELLVLDEPTVGLDPVLRRDLWRLFARTAAAGATVLVSSHVMDEAARCDRLLLMRDGVVIADDTLPDLLQRTGTGDVEAAFLALVEAPASGGTAT